MKRNLSEYYPKLVKRNLQRLKKEKNWTIIKMSIELGVSESYMGSLLSLKSNKVPSVSLLGQFCEKTNINIEYFFED